ncbi:MAG: hypothetical protein KKF46_05990 [Nanoarchaeota archaeon]|nr:hypothetical protein [Nanoarchaeota archaeon]MBU1321884.1 hypothetical protein [Nanoarchaeota archaeon]MBU1597659.1 hypothetical protein [Nanoarchaeota archaeon]MBU2442222.1 hypothetical protein [Nanoarchaeota archaeon]
MKKKTLDILIIEDNPKHLEDAKAEVQSRIKAGTHIAADYAVTYVQAKELMQQKKYQGIITDVFFPYDDQQRQDAKKGWHPEAATEIFGLIKDICERYRDPEIRDAVNRWREGKTMHPTGILITEQAIEQGTPVIFCTDTYHHGITTQPVFSYACDDDKRIGMVDCYKAGYYGTAWKKDWKESLDVITRKIKLGY